MYIYLHKGILLSHACAKLLQSCMTLYDPMDCSPPGSSVHGISQARILEWLSCSSPYLAIKRMKYCHLQQHEWIWRILYLVSFICGILNNTKESIYKAETDTQTQKTNLWLPGERGERRDKLEEYGINRHKLLYMK